MKIITIVGARPQFIKAAVVSRAISKKNDYISEENLKIEEIYVHTGQHFDDSMSKIFFNEMSIPTPLYNLRINCLSHGAMTGRMLEKIESVLLYEDPQIVLIYGDTNSTLAGALAASKLHIPVAHVEAGLRSFNRRMPEEINRILSDHIANILFCPTIQAEKNLYAEGILNNYNFASYYELLNNSIKNVYLVGDVMFDSALYYSNFERKPSFEVSDKFVIATVHREENISNINNLQSILNALDEISKEIQVILPIHPGTKKKLANSKIINEYKNIRFREPVGYLEMIYLLKRTNMVLTDSGGLQKEAFFFKKPCVTLRKETEWVELNNSKCNILSGNQTSEIIECYNEMKKRTIDFNIPLYGNGDASKKIVEHLLSFCPK